VKTIYLVRDEIATAEQDRQVLNRYEVEGPLAQTLPNVAAVVAAVTSRILRIVAGVEVAPEMGLDVDFMCWKASQYAARGLDLNQLVWVSTAGRVRSLRTGLPLTAGRLA